MNVFWKVQRYGKRKAELNILLYFWQGCQRYSPQDSWRDWELRGGVQACLQNLGHRALVGICATRGQSATRGQISCINLCATTIHPAFKVGLYPVHDEPCSWDLAQGAGQSWHLHSSSSCKSMAGKLMLLPIDRATWERVGLYLGIGGL